VVKNVTKSPSLMITSTSEFE